ncbi:MAG: HlyD family efflux transporter periplasmic adaptor subunit [Elusimicrobia bacterium]|nr:HlyD family efflux transporter periplasmic adaptor subunit [Elusimicrobiota bacterium]
MIKKDTAAVIFFILIIVSGGVLSGCSRKTQGEGQTVIAPSTGWIADYITATATVKPQNRLEINPPISGRIEKVLVEEGERVNAGETLVLMSSSDRAALLDAARLDGEATLKKWEEVYKMTPLIAPIEGEVIVQTIKPGKNVTTSDVVLVLSDRLIVKAQVDETDIGKVQLGQKVRISLDAYPQIQVSGSVDHIYYESTVVNNVTTYDVDIVPDEIPDVFRSGMSATVSIVRESVEKALLLPRDAVRQENGQSSVLVETDGKPERRGVVTGLSDEKNVQITEGLTTDDRVVIVPDKVSSTATRGTKNPFMPSSPWGSRRSGAGRP